MSAIYERSILVITALLVVSMALIMGAPSSAFKQVGSANATTLLGNETKPTENETMFMGVDHRLRKNNTNPCRPKTNGKDDDSVCVFFIFCQLGTLQVFENGNAFRGPQYLNHCPYFDDACCKPDLELIEDYISRNSSIKLSATKP